MACHPGTIFRHDEYLFLSCPEMTRLLFLATVYCITDRHQLPTSLEVTMKRHPSMLFVAAKNMFVHILYLSVNTITPEPLVISNYNVQNMVPFELTLYL